MEKESSASFLKYNGLQERCLVAAKNIGFAKLDAERLFAYCLFSIGALDFVQNSPGHKEVRKKRISMAGHLFKELDKIQKLASETLHKIPRYPNEDEDDFEQSLTYLTQFQNKLLDVLTLPENFGPFAA